MDGRPVRAVVRRHDLRAAAATGCDRSEEEAKPRLGGGAAQSPAYGAALMYLKPLSTASVTTTASAPSCSARRRAPTTFAPVETPAKMPSSCARRLVISIAWSSSIVQTSSTRLRSNCGATELLQPCIAKAPLGPPVIP